MPDSCTILRKPTGAPEDAAPVLAVESLPLAVVLDQRTMLLFGWLASAPPETASVSFGGAPCTAAGRRRPGERRKPMMPTLAILWRCCGPRTSCARRPCRWF